jgi:flagellin-like protein
MKLFKYKKAVTPIIAVIMLLLITISLAGMAMMIFTLLGTSSQAEIAAQMKEYNIRADISNAKAEPNTNNFEFKLKNYAKIKLPIDNQNTKIILNANGIPVTCYFGEDKGGGYYGKGEERDCTCQLFEGGNNGEQTPSNDWKTGLKPGIDYYANCTYSKETFSIVKNYVVEWYYLGESGEKLLDSEPVEVGAVS